MLGQNWAGKSETEGGEWHVERQAANGWGIGGQTGKPELRMYKQKMKYLEQLLYHGKKSVAQKKGTPGKAKQVNPGEKRPSG